MKSGFATTFVDHAAAMIEQIRPKFESMGNKANKATLLVADIVEMPAVPMDTFELVLAMGDPLSICSDANRACREMARITRPDGIVIATADNKLAAIDHFIERGSLDELESFINSGRTNWLTADERERFELTTFTPQSLAVCSMPMDLKPSTSRARLFCRFDRIKNCWNTRRVRAAIGIGSGTDQRSHFCRSCGSFADCGKRWYPFSGPGWGCVGEVIRPKKARPSAWGHWR